MTLWAAGGTALIVVVAVALALLIVGQHARRNALRSALLDMAQQRSEWVAVWKKRIQSDTSPQADTCRAALASASAAQHHAQSDWLRSEGTDVVLTMEWFVDRALSGWVRQAHAVHNEQAYLTWRTAWASQRAWVNQHAQTHNQIFSHPSGRLLARILGWTAATDWIEEATHIHRMSILRAALDSENG